MNRCIFIALVSIILALNFEAASNGQQINLRVELLYTHLIDELQSVESVEWSPEGEFVAVGGGGGVLIFNGDLHMHSHLVSDLEQYNFTTLNWSPDSSELASTGIQLGVGTVTAIINVETENYLSLSHNIISTPIIWSPSGELIALGLANETVIIIDSETSNILFEFQVDDEPTGRNYPTGLCWLSESELMAVYGLHIYHFDLLEAILIEEFGGMVVSESSECSVISNLIITASGQLFDLVTNEWFQTDDDILGFDVALNPLKPYAAFNEANSQIEIRLLPELEVLATMEGGMGQQNGFVSYYDDSIDWSPNGELLAAVGEDNILRVWRVVEEEEGIYEQTN